MIAMIMAAGLGTRLKPWTDLHPKALVPIDGVPALERLINRLAEHGFSKIVVNIHHFADQMREFITSLNTDVEILISDESENLLDTGGALVKAIDMFGTEPVLIHNVDIISNCDLTALKNSYHPETDDIVLVTSDRESSRKLLFDNDENLIGWHDLRKDEYRPENFLPAAAMFEDAFSGIYIVNNKALNSIKDYGIKIKKQKFPIMDYLLSFPSSVKIKRRFESGLRLLDIGKPEALAKAKSFLA